MQPRSSFSLPAGELVGGIPAALLRLQLQRPDEVQTLCAWLDVWFDDPEGAKWVPAPYLPPQIRSCYFLLGSAEDEETPRVDDFLEHTLPRLLRLLNRQTERRLVEQRGGVRGRVHWPASLKARYGAYHDPARLVCTEVHHQYDTLENQLLRFVVERLREAVWAVPPALRDGLAVFTDRPAEATRARLHDMESALTQALRTGVLRDVPPPPSITLDHLVRAGSARSLEYRPVVDLYHRHRRIVRDRSWAPVLDVARRALLLPGTAGSAGEPWLRLAAALLAARNRA